MIDRELKLFLNEWFASSELNRLHENYGGGRIFSDPIIGVAKGDDPIIEKFKEVYHKGLEDKKILENLKEFNIVTRAEVKAIEDALIKYEKLSKREISVKEQKEKRRQEFLKRS